MTIPRGVNIPMPRPFGGNPPVITRVPKGDADSPGEYITVQLVGVIGPLTQFLELLEVFDKATENDTIEIMIDTPGGDVHTSINLLERMENCRAHVITTASGLVASAGSFLWFYGQERRVNRWAKFMIHCSSHGDFGRSLSILESSEKLVKYMKELGLEMLGAGLITRAEYVAAFENKADVELSAATVRARLGLGKLRASADGLPAEPAPAAEPPVVDPAAPVDPAAAPAEPAAPAAPAEPAATPADPTAKCGGKKKMRRRVVRAADGTTQIIEEPVEEPAAPAAPADPAATPAVDPAAPAPEPPPAGDGEQMVVDFLQILNEGEVPPAEPAPAAPPPAEPAVPSPEPVPPAEPAPAAPAAPAAEPVAPAARA